MLSIIFLFKPKLKELLEFIHTDGENFKVKVVSKQETDFDAMFHFLEDKNLFAFWQDENSNKKSRIFINPEMEVFYEKITFSKVKNLILRK